MLWSSSHPLTASSCVSPVRVDRSRIAPLEISLTMARSEPSGDRLQLHIGSACGGSEVLPVLTLNRKVSVVSSLIMLYMHSVDGKLAHCTFQMLASLRTRRGGPPAIGMATMEDGVSGLAYLGVEIYRISEPSGVNLGCWSCSALVITVSG